ncbi:MAG TPA: SMC family ATPase [Gemmatimonadaceae bacterium]|nr:SMC family ATPase [Gemmatimonadaceae bacterium]
MKLRAIKLTNFRQHADTSIEFGPGITGVIGPNGTGKTTILEGIAWALYGNEAARGRRDTIRFARADAKAPVRVDLDFELSGHRYRVSRGLTSAELYLDGAEQPIANSLTSVSEQLQRRIGMTRSEFFNTYFTGQRELGVMTSLGPTERAQFLSRVLGYERLRAAQDLARDRRRELVGELNGLRASMPDPSVIAQRVADAVARLSEATARADAARKACDESERALAVLAPQWTQAQAERDRRQQVAGELRIADADAASRDRERERAAAVVLEVDAAAADLAAIAPQLAPLPDLKRECAALDALAQQDGRRRALLESIKAVDAELVRLTARRGELAGVSRAHDDAAAALEGARVKLTAAEATLEAALTAWVQDKQATITRRDHLRQQFSDVREQREKIVEAGEDGTCPTCQRPLGTHFRSMLDTLDAQMEAITADGKWLNQRHEQLEKKPDTVTQLEDARRGLSKDVEKIQQRVATSQAGIKELAELDKVIARQEIRLQDLKGEIAQAAEPYDATRHAVVRHEIERLAPLETRATRLAALADRGAAVRDALVAAKDAWRAAVTRAQALRDSLATLGGDDAAFDTMRVAFERARATVEAARLALVKAETETAAAGDGMRAAERDKQAFEQAQQRLDHVTRERRLHDELDQTFTDLRTDLNADLRPEVSRIASGFLEQLTSGRYSELSLDDQYNMVVVEDGAPKPVISGGEEDLANLALRLAISEMIADRSGRSFSLLILDEVFGSLDDINRQNVLDLLQALRDRFEQVVLITHVDAVAQGSIDTRLTLERDLETGASIVHVERAAGFEPAIEAAVA